MIDGEVVLFGIDGRSDFNGLHSRRHDDEAQFYALDMLVSDGEDLRKLPLSHAQGQHGAAVGAPREGIFLSDFEQGEIGPDLFRHACLMFRKPSLYPAELRHRDTRRILRVSRSIPEPKPDRRPAIVP